MSKKALVVSGGGSKGAFAVGVIKAILAQYPGTQFDILVGTSTGSLIVPFVAANDISLLEEMYTTISTAQVVLSGDLIANFKNSVSLFDATPLFNLIQQYYNINEATKILGLDKELYITTTCLQTSETVVYSNKGPIPNSDFDFVTFAGAAEFQRAVLASACQPVFMQPIEIDPMVNPIRQYVDGGVKQYLGLQIAVDAGAEEIIAISLSPIDNEIETKEYTHATDILFKTIDIFTTDVGVNNYKLPALYNSALEYINAVKNNLLTAGIDPAKVDAFFNVPSSPMFAGRGPIKIRHIYPDAPLGGGLGGLTFNSTEMIAMLNQGENKVAAIVASLDPGESIFG